MTCSDARQYIFAFLDNELDAALSLEVQQHIEHCPHCARECEIENAVRRQLSEKLLHVDDIPRLDESTLLESLQVGREAARPSPRRTRWVWMARAAATIAAGLLLMVTWRIATRNGASTQESLADVLVDDFDHFVTENKPLQIVSSDADEVARWLQERTALAVQIPPTKSAVATLQGGRKCTINGKAAAFAVYRLGDDLACVVALVEPAESLASMKRIERDGHVHWVDRCRGHTVLACRRGELVYAVVSRLPEESLSALMPPAGG